MTLKHIYAIGVQYYRAAGIFQDGTNSSKAALSPAEAAADQAGILILQMSEDLRHSLRAQLPVLIRQGKNHRLC